MKTVNIGELKNQLSSYLKYVQSGEEVVICDRRVPVARISPLRKDEDWEREARLVAAGVIKMPDKELDVEAFLALPRGRVSEDVAVQAVIDSRGDW